MIYKLTLNSIFIILFCTATAITSAAPKTQSKSINFKTQEMQVLSLQEWDAAGIQIPEVREALAHYQETANYTLSDEQFLENPDLYFSQRIKALGHLLNVIPQDNLNPTLSLIKKHAENKLLYLESLPDPLDPRCTKPEIHLKKKAVNVADQYWYEIMDPLHRFGPEVNVYLTKWGLSKIPNYFIYLETVEKHPMLNLVAPFEHHLKYFYTDEERAPHRLQFKDGSVFLQDIIFDTHERNPYEGTCIYVLGLDEEFYVNDHVIFGLHHSSEFAGGQIIGAGEITVEKGKIKSISDRSGHYMPTSDDMLATLRVLEKKQGNLADVEVHIFQFNRFSITIANFNAQEFLNKNGRAPALSASQGWTPLHVAVNNNHVELSSATIRDDALNAKENVQGQTPLHFAAQQGFCDWVKILIDAGADPAILDNDGNNPLKLAALNGYGEIVAILLPYESKGGNMDKKGATPLLLAIKSGSLQLVQKLIQSGEKLSDSDSEGNTIFHYAAGKKDNAEMLHYLLKTDQAFLINQENLIGATPLHYAAKEGDGEMMEILLGQGMDLLKKDHRGFTPLHYAVEEGNKNAVVFILNRDDQNLVGQVTNDGKTALHLAAGKMHYELFDKFLASGMPIDITDNAGNTPLYYAIVSRSWLNMENVSYFMARNANPRLLNNEGTSSLHVAALQGEEKLVPILIESNDLFSDLSLQDYMGNTPVHIALQKGIALKMSFVFEYLLSKTPIEIFQIKNNEGLTPKDLLRQFLNDNPNVSPKVYESYIAINYAIEGDGQR